jgi:hypothetical protein
VPSVSSTSRRLPSGNVSFKLSFFGSPLGIDDSPKPEVIEGADHLARRNAAIERRTVGAERLDAASAESSTTMPITRPSPATIRPPLLPGRMIAENRETLGLATPAAVVDFLFWRRDNPGRSR